MPTAVLERLPNTVSACHAEITKLRATAADSGRVADLEQELEDMKAKLEQSELENEALMRRVDEMDDAANPDAIVAIEEFLLEVQRPVGKYKFDVLHGPATDRAILGLYDAAGRQP